MKPALEYIANQPEKYRAIIYNLMACIEKEVPNAKLLYKWKIPYYYVNNKPFCYLAPNHKEKFVDLGFAKGFQLVNNTNFLVSKNRNTVKSLRYYSMEAIDFEVLQSVLTEASQL